MMRRNRRTTRSSARSLSGTRSACRFRLSFAQLAAPTPEPITSMSSCATCGNGWIAAAKTNHRRNTSSASPSCASSWRRLAMNLLDNVALYITEDCQGANGELRDDEILNRAAHGLIDYVFEFLDNHGHGAPPNHHI